jgi:serine/threonine protein kinase
MSPLHPEVGLRVGDRYQLTERIAGGGMGEVWVARDEVLGREVAVKILRRELADDIGFLERFRAEARHAASLSHPGIASVFDYGEESGSAYLVMELVRGEPLSQRLAREGALTAAVAVPLLQQVAHALQAAHCAGLVHRDVKPANLLITPDEHVKVTDFGIARAGGQAALTRTGEVMGTAQYLSPEQALGRPATAASDVYSLGVVAYETLSGVRPFEADTAIAIAMAQVNRIPEPLPATVAPAVAAVVMQSLAKDPALRPASADQFADQLGAAVAVAATTQVIGPHLARTSVMPAVADDAPVLAPAGRPPHRARELGLGLLVAAVVLAVLLLALGQRSNPGRATSGPSTTHSSSPSTATTSSPPSVQVVPTDYIGQDTRVAVAALSALGLAARVQPVVTDMAQAGSVVALAPTGTVHPGDTVTLQVAVPPQDHGDWG